MTTACWTVTKRSVQAGQWAHDEWMGILVLHWYSMRVNMCVLSWWHSDGPECRERELLSLRFNDANECFLSSCHRFFIFKFDRKRWTSNPFYVRSKHYTLAQSASSGCDCARKTVQIIKTQHSQAEECVTKKAKWTFKVAKWLIVCCYFKETPTVAWIAV